MGKSNNFFVLDLSRPHEEFKQFCFGWTFQDDLDEMHNEVESKDPNHCIYADPNRFEKWCRVCLQYISPAFGCVNELHISHPTSNPIWSSHWNANNVIIGKRSRKFKGFYEIDEEAIQWAYQELERLGTPLRKSDKEANKESLDILEWANTMIGRRFLVLNEL